MSDLDICELTLIDHSSAQRAALERWIPILLIAGISADETEEIRRCLRDTRQPAKRDPLTFDNYLKREAI